MPADEAGAFGLPPRRVLRPEGDEPLQDLGGAHVPVSMPENLAEEALRPGRHVAAKKASLAASTTTSPSSMNTIRSATLRAKPISCVTTTEVMPSAASSRITSSTSLIISGSRAEVGSS